MPDIRIHHYAVDPTETDTFLAKRAELIGAIRAEHPGLAEARLIRLEDGTFIDTWRWESADQMRAALAAAPTVPEVRAAMSLTRDARNQDGDIIDER
jgi:Antibiotic biosynthesis monooxygenase